MMMIVIMAMIMVMLMGMLVMLFEVRHLVCVIVVVMMLFETPLLAGPLQFGFESAANSRILLVLLDLFNLERNAETLRKVAFGDREISSDAGAGIEVLMKLEKRR
jgi:hypothetical protein